jgi:anti-sigma regulatory factor (Ser/Thr protein kinase)
MQYLELHTDLNELPRLSAFARTVGRNEGLDSDRMLALELCLEEAVANIILHGGSENAAEKKILVTITNENQTLVACLEDNGPLFDPTTVETPAVPASLEEAKVGGLGVHLIRKMTTDMRYDRIKNRNRLTLVFAAPANPRNS